MKSTNEDRLAPQIYAAVGEFIERCLRNRKSLVLNDDDELWGSVWTAESTQQLIDLFIESPDESKRSFIVKLRDQLEEAPPSSVQLLVELAWFHFLIAHQSSMLGDTKRKKVAEIASIANARVAAGPLAEAMDGGICSPGTSFHTRRPNQLWLLIRFAHRWVTAGLQENERWLTDPWAFREMVFDLEGVADQTQRHALLHLIHPDTFEDMVSQYVKRDIANAFALPHEVGISDDHTIAAIRTRLTDEHGEKFSFYDDDLRSVWAPEAPSAAREPDVEPDPHRQGLLEDADAQAWLIRASGGELVPEWLERGICAIYFEDTFPFAVELGKSKDELRAMAEDVGVDTSAGRFNNVLGQVWRFVNSIEVGDYVVTVRGQDIYLGVVASHAQSLGGRARRETIRSVEWLNADKPVRRSLVAPAVYSKMKTLLTLTNITSVIDSLERWANDRFPSADDEPKGSKAVLLAADKKLAKKLLIRKGWLDEVIGLLRDKGQIVFYGPPGTGKTYIAQHLTDHLTKLGGTTELVQFHPSYTYEDFFEGYRPVSTTGSSVGFAIKPGPLRRIAAAAEEARDQPHFLVIDEINRANLAKVFGELYFLLEYRDQVITLQYSDEEFTLPENLYIIGTMNTADRSIALVDSAMRRRFYFVEMAPSEEPVSGLLRRWLADQKLATWPADLLDALNTQIGDPDAEIGPSFFMTPDLLESGRLEQIWRYSIMPLLRERLYGQGPEVLNRLSLKAVRASLPSVEQSES